MTPTLSIIIPVYNVEKYLPKCLDSILVDNTFTGQVICVNDGSTDNSQIILEQYAAKYPNIEIISQENSGLSEARNVGFDRAKGDYVFFVDSDDWIEIGAIERIMGQIDGEEVLYFNARIYEDTTKSFKEPIDIKAYSKINGYEYFSLVYNQPQNMLCVCVCLGIYSREFLKKNNIYHEPGILHEDELFTPQVLLKAKQVSSLNEYVYVYRRRQGSITSRVTKKHLKDILFIARNLYTICSARQNVQCVFFQDIFNLYSEVILRAYDNRIKVNGLWRRADSTAMLNSAIDTRSKKIAKLTFVSLYIAYKYMNNTIAPIVRKIINRYC